MRKTRNKMTAGMALAVAALMAAGCSTTRALPEGEQLFTGLKPIEYINYEPCQHAEDTKIEMESVLASTPNGALFGSSYYRSPSNPSCGYGTPSRRAAHTWRGGLRAPSEPSPS